MNTTVQYAPRAYEFIRNCKATNDGFGIAGVGQEMPMTEMTPFEWDKVHAFPVCSSSTTTTCSMLLF